MAYHLTTQFGAMERNPSPERMAEVIDGIDPDDDKPRTEATMKDPD